jgi:hypothetical protein
MNLMAVGVPFPALPASLYQPAVQRAEAVKRKSISPPARSFSPPPR